MIMKKRKKEYYGDVRYENGDSYDWAALEYWDVVPSKNGNYVQSKYIPVNPNEINKIKPIHSKYTNKRIKDGFPDGNGGMI